MPNCNLSTKQKMASAAPSRFISESDTDKRGTMVLIITCMTCSVSKTESAAMHLADMCRIAEASFCNNSHNLGKESKS